jgi:hypothetical protein
MYWTRVNKVSGANGKHTQGFKRCESELDLALRLRQVESAALSAIVQGESPRPARRGGQRVPKLIRWAPSIIVQIFNRELTQCAAIRFAMSAASFLRTPGRLRKPSRRRRGDPWPRTSDPGCCSCRPGRHGIAPAAGFQLQRLPDEIGPPKWRHLKRLSLAAFGRPLTFLRAIC